MNSKRGILGGIIATFVAVIVIVIILLIFVLSSGIIKKMAGVEEGVRVYNETDVGIDNIFGYLPDYFTLANVKVAIRQGQSFEDASQGANYDG